MRRHTVDFSRLRILIVENHALMRRLLAEMLRGFGVRQVHETRTVSQALCRIYEQDYDAVILDFFLGDMDGADFAHRIRRDPACRNREAPILLITAMPDHHKVLKVRDAGINAMLAKPIAPRDLYGRIYAMLARPRPLVAAPGHAGPARDRGRRLPAGAAPAARRARAPLPEIRRRPPPGDPANEDRILI